MNNINYVEYSDVYKSRVVDLLNLCFNNKNITDVSFTWKHLDTYFEDKQFAYVAIENNKVCAFVCFTPMTVTLNNSEELFYSCSIQATHPDYRRRGIISDLTQIIEKEIGEANYFGFSNNSGLQIDLNSKKINYQILGQMENRYIIPNIFDKKYEILEVDNFDNLVINEFKSSLCEFKKDESYLNWRYFRNPKINLVTLKL